MKFTATIAAVALAALGCGCLGPAPQVRKYWNLEWTGKFATTASPTLGSVRMDATVVNAPYSEPRFTVLRSDGSVAFDDFNGFAAAPAQLLKAASDKAVKASGLFSGVAAGGPLVSSDNTLSVVVEELALDCRDAGKRVASVRVRLMLSRMRNVVAETAGAARVEVTDGNYTYAFSQAYSEAMTDALVELSKSATAQ